MLVGFDEIIGTGVSVTVSVTGSIAAGPTAWVTRIDA